MDYDLAATHGILTAHPKGEGSPAMGIRDWLYVNAVLPNLPMERSEGLARRLRFYEQKEKDPPSALRDYQWGLLQELIKHAYHTSPFYRSRFDTAGLNVLHFTRQDLSRVPPLTRMQIKANLDDLRSVKFEKSSLAVSATGGTTDTPVPFYRNIESVYDKVAIQTRFNAWAGMRPGDKVFSLWGARNDYPETPSWRWRLYERGLMRRLWAPSALLNGPILERYREQLNSFRPKVIYAYPTPLGLFCDYLKSAGKPFHRPAVVITTAEALLPEQRKKVEDLFGIPVSNHYGAREFGMIAAQCEEHQGLHLNPAAAYLEFIPVKGAEREGLHEVLVTDLLNFGMPLIRYQVNDCAILDSNLCKCGRPYPLIREIVGRTGDLFQLPDGSTVPGVGLTNRLLRVCAGLHKVQVVQETIRTFHIRYVPSESFSPADLDLLRSKLIDFFPVPLHWTFERVSEIEREPSGKTRFCISHVSRSVQPEPASI